MSEATNWILVRYTNSECASASMFGQESTGYAYLMCGSIREAGGDLPGKFCPRIQTLFTMYIHIYI